MPSTDTPSRRAKETALFVPELVYFEPAALEYPKGQRILDWVKERGLPYRTIARAYQTSMVRSKLPFLPSRQAFMRMRAGMKLPPR